jgi:small-conductance mechanosensitive channel
MSDWFPEQWSRIRLAENALVEWIVAIAVAVLVALLSRLLQGLLTGRMSKATARTVTRIDDVVVSVLRGTKVVFHIALGVLVGQHLVRVPASATGVVHVALTLAFTLQLGVWATRAANGVISIWATGRDHGHEATRAAGLGFLARLVIWSFVVLIALANFGIELSAVIAGLGVGGVAAALAVQSTLGDLFAGVSMYFDRPFDIGDFVGIDTLRGTVIKIGIKTTRIQSIDGEELVLPNGEIAKARIRNFARLKERRILFRFGIAYESEPAKVERAVEITRMAVGRREGLRFERAHFVALGTTSLEIEVVYHVLSPEYATYLEHQQAINLDLFRAFKEEGIAFSYSMQPPLPAKAN